jgi:hypothetical protein
MHALIVRGGKEILKKKKKKKKISDFRSVFKDFDSRYSF